jgi:thiosulfate/3-mercaptopyruvate sulfurtransferase
VGPLISAPALAAALEGPQPPAVLDVRWQLGRPPGREEYLRGHIPGAAFVDLESELAGLPGAAGRHPLPEPGVFERAMRAAGVSGERPAVVYDGAGAPRAWWVLRFFGHPSVAVLDGGLAAWEAAGYAVETGESSIRAGDFVARPGGMPVLDAAGAAALAGGSGVLLDARAPERYRGEVEPVDPVAGHIPGAVNVPATVNIGAESRFRPAEELREQFERAGVRAGVAVGAYCGSGVSAAVDVLALELAGYPGAALYVGSWSEWITDPRRPVAAEGRADGPGSPAPGSAAPG